MHGNKMLNGWNGSAGIEATDLWHKSIRTKEKTRDDKSKCSRKNARAPHSWRQRGLCVCVHRYNKRF